MIITTQKMDFLSHKKRKYINETVLKYINETVFKYINETVFVLLIVAKHAIFRLVLTILQAIRRFFCIPES